MWINHAQLHLYEEQTCQGLQGVSMRDPMRLSHQRARSSAPSLDGMPSCSLAIYEVLQ